jgi:hypothetical protein
LARRFAEEPPDGCATIAFVASLIDRVASASATRASRGATTPAVAFTRKRQRWLANAALRPRSSVDYVAAVANVTHSRDRRG